VEVDDFESEAGDSLHEAGEGGGVGQFGAQGGGVWAGGDLAVVELRAEGGTGLAGEGDFVGLWSHRGHASQSGGSGVLSAWLAGGWVSPSCGG
jgi:hypothetical protein